MLKPLPDYLRNARRTFDSIEHLVRVFTWLDTLEFSDLERARHEQPYIAALKDQNISEAYEALLWWTDRYRGLPTPEGVLTIISMARTPLTFGVRSGCYQ